MVNNQKKWSDTERAAYHEAGHVVAAYLQRIRFVYCSVDQKDFVEEDADGLVRIARSVVSSLANIDMTYNPPRSKIERYIQVCLAGAVSESILSGKYNKDGCQDDLDKATNLAGHLSGSIEETSAYVNWLFERINNELNLPWNQQAIRFVARALLKHKRIGYREARRITKEGIDKFNGNTPNETLSI